MVYLTLYGAFTRFAHVVCSYSCKSPPSRSRRLTVSGCDSVHVVTEAYSSYVAKNPHEQARLIKTLVSNSTFDRGSLSPTYIKPFDVFANGSKSGDWLLGLDSNQQPSG